MKPVDVSKTAMLPNRKAMNQIGKSGRSILDYSKASPLNVQTPGPNLIANLAANPKAK